MLNAEQTLYSKNEDKSIKHHMILPAVYLQFGPQDAMEEKENTVKDEKSGKASVLKYKVPVFTKTENDKQVDVVSAHDPADLLSVAKDYYKEKYPNSDPILRILADASTGLNARLKIENAPAKQIDADTAIAKVVKVLRGMGMSESEALERARAAAASKAA